MGQNINYKGATMEDSDVEKSHVYIFEDILIESAKVMLPDCDLLRARLGNHRRQSSVAIIFAFTAHNF